MRPQGTLMEWRAEDAGKSESRSVMEWIGVGHDSTVQTGRLPAGRFVTREQVEPSQEEIANEHGLHVCIPRRSECMGTARLDSL